MKNRLTKEETIILNILLAKRDGVEAINPDESLSKENKPKRPTKEQIDLVRERLNQSKAKQWITKPNKNK
jgi:hypothetical protein